MSNWIAEVAGKMHINRVTNIDVARKLDVTPQYISAILNGKKSPKGVEERITAAVDDIIAEREKVC